MMSNEIKTIKNASHSSDCCCSSSIHILIAHSIQLKRRKKRKTTFESLWLYCTTNFGCFEPFECYSTWMVELHMSLISLVINLVDAFVLGLVLVSISMQRGFQQLFNLTKSTTFVCFYFCLFYRCANSTSPAAEPGNMLINKLAGILHYYLGFWAILLCIFVSNV